MTGGEGLFILSTFSGIALIGNNKSQYIEPGEEKEGVQRLLVMRLLH